MTKEEANASEILKSIRASVERKQESMKSTSRIATLWLQYMEMVDLLRTCIKAERTANWELHLDVVTKMLPYFSASGHNLYTKCTLLYVKSMKSLKEKQPEVYRKLASRYHVVRRSNRSWAGISTDLAIEQALMRSLKTTGGLTRGSGMDERQRITWLLSMPACADVNWAMQELTGVKYDSSEQNKDMTASRQDRDLKDTNLILKALADGKNPFDQEQATLKNIMTGVHAEKAVDVDEARKKGEKIIAGMVGKSALEYTFKRSEQCVTMATKSSVKIDGERVQVDPQLLFQRLVIACVRSDDLEEVFQYELCSFPAALFDSPLTLRQPQKAMLANWLWDNISNDAKRGPTDSVYYVLDGGSLLHRVHWQKQVTYAELCKHHCEYVLRKYGTQTTVVFDGYDHPSTKNMTHQRRTTGKSSATVSFSDGMKVTAKRDAFLTNEENKKKLIAMLRRYLEEAGVRTRQANGDADVLIVKTGIECATTRTTVLVGDDTDLLVLLCYYTQEDNHDIYFRPEPKANSGKHRVWDIKKMKADLGMELCKNMLFLHALLGCDTTSRPFGIGKSASLKMFQESPTFRNHAEVFNASTSTTDMIINAGERALAELYGAKRGESLDILRYRKYYEKVATQGRQIQPQNLPPTIAAAKYHSLRVFLQVKQWQGLDEKLLVNDWGWKVNDDQVLPVTTDLPAAPQNLLKMIRCNCASNCSTARCSCRKHGLECSPACGQCRGVSCTNSVDPDDSEDVDVV